MPHPAFRFSSSRSFPGRTRRTGPTRYKPGVQNSLMHSHSVTVFSVANYEMRSFDTSRYAEALLQRGVETRILPGIKTRYVTDKKLAVTWCIGVVWTWTIPDYEP